MDSVRAIRTLAGMKVSEAAAGLKRLRTQAGMSVRELADALGKPPSTYSSYEDKFKKPFLPVDMTLALVPILSAKGISRADVLRLGGIEGEAPATPKVAKVPESSESPLSDINMGVMSQDLPILGSGACGDDGLFELNGQIQDFKRRPPKLTGVKDAYGLWVKGDSMFPWRKNGGLVFVHPHQPVNIGDFVVVQIKADGDGAPVPAYIKQLIRRTSRDVRLMQFNPNEELSVPTSKVHAIHRIVDWDELMGL